jgi:hypothetical protein
MGNWLINFVYLPVWQHFLSSEHPSYLVTIKDEQQIGMSYQSADFGHFAVLALQLYHHLVQVLNFVLS